MGVMGAMGRLVLGLVLGLVLAYCVTRFSFSLWKGFVGLKGTGLEMDWIGLIRWIDGGNNRIGQDRIRWETGSEK